MKYWDAILISSTTVAGGAVIIVSHRLFARRLTRQNQKPDKERT